MSRSKRSLILSFLAVAFTSFPASAGLITWEFEGQVTSFFDGNNLLGGSVSVGTPFSGSFTFDTTTPDSQPADMVVGDFVNAVTFFAGTVGGNAFAAAMPLNLLVRDNASPTFFPHDTYGIDGPVGLADETVNFFLQLQDNTANMFTSDMMPVVPPSLDGLAFAVLGLSSQALDLTISGDVTVLTPEPGTLCLVGLVALVLLNRRAVWHAGALTGRRRSRTPRIGAVLIAILGGDLVSDVRAQGVCGCMDIVFVIDVTGSLDPALQKVKDDLRILVQNTAVAASGGDLRLGLITFNDFGLPPDSVTVRSPLTTDINTVLNQIDALSAAGGGNLPEASDEALREMLGGTVCASVGDFNVPFRSSCIKHAILITDNLPAGCNDQFDNPGDKDNAHARALEALAAGIMISAIYPPTADSAGPCGNPITNLACIIMQDYALTTRGVFAEVASDGDGIAAALVDQIGQCPDCNNNAINDLCDIDCAASPDCVPPCGGFADCDTNGIIDDCDIVHCPSSDSRCSDCNGNTVPDECDLVDGSSCDLNADGVPDECGACCEDSICHNTMWWLCQFGLFADGVACEAGSCDIRRCCLGSTCRTDLTRSQCLALSSFPASFATTCNGECATGACCPASGSCFHNTSESLCDAQNGTFFGSALCSFVGLCDAPIVDCDKDCLDDPPGTQPANLDFDALALTEYPCGTSLPRIGNNILRFEFDSVVPAPLPGEIEIRELFDNGVFGPDISPSFVITVEGAGNNILTITEPGQVFTNETWYAITNTVTSTSGWCAASDFEVDYGVVYGDANGTFATSFTDLSSIRANFADPIDTPDNSRFDINTVGGISNADLSAARANFTLGAVAKPSGHDCSGASQQSQSGGPTSETSTLTVSGTAGSLTDVEEGSPEEFVAWFPDFVSVLEVPKSEERDILDELLQDLVTLGVEILTRDQRDTVAGALTDTSRTFADPIIAAKAQDMARIIAP